MAVKELGIVYKAISCPSIRLSINDKKLLVWTPTVGKLSPFPF